MKVCRSSNLMILFFRKIALRKRSRLLQSGSNESYFLSTMITDYIIFLYLAKDLREQRKLSDGDLSFSGFFTFEGVIYFF